MILPIVNKIILLLGCLTITSLAQKGQPMVYTAEISEISGSDSGISGVVSVFVPPEDEFFGYVGYGGFLQNAPRNLEASKCASNNGCGVHIHNGMSCRDSDRQGGHYFLQSTLKDPWAQERYSSDSMGSATFSSIVYIGTNIVDGLPFVVHDENGSRIGCGILEPAHPLDLMTSTIYPLAGSKVHGEVHMNKMAVNSAMKAVGAICYYGVGFGLEPNLLSFHKSSAISTGSEYGLNCTAPNGCGIHIHSGSSCETTTDQGGHYYNSVDINVDPWAKLGYTSTNEEGTTQFMHCVKTGEKDYTRKVFVIHANDGSRVACGKLHGDTGFTRPIPILLIVIIIFALPFLILTLNR